MHQVVGDVIPFHYMQVSATNPALLADRAGPGHVMEKSWPFKQTETMREADAKFRNFDLFLSRWNPAGISRISELGWNIVRMKERMRGLSLEK